jgi:hypothetical protein
MQDWKSIGIAKKKDGNAYAKQMAEKHRNFYTNNRLIITLFLN